MQAYFRTLAVVVGSLTLGTAGAAAQEVHEIRMVEAGRGEYRFEPSSVSAAPGDILLFKAISGAPHSVVFEGRGLSADARQKLNAALPRRTGDLSSPLLTKDAEYRVVVPALAAGTYRFFCLPHRAYDMRGELQVK